MMKCIELSNLFNLNFSPESDLRGFFKVLHSHLYDVWYKGIKNEYN